MISHKFPSPVLAFVTILCFICNSAYRSLLDQETIFIRAPARPLFAGCFFSLLSIVSQNNSDTYSSLGIFYSFIFSLSLFLLRTLIFIFFFSSIFYFLWLKYFECVFFPLSTLLNTFVYVQFMHKQNAIQYCSFFASFHRDINGMNERL